MPISVILVDPLGPVPVPEPSVTSGIFNVIRYYGDPRVPQDILRRRHQVMEAMRRFGSPVVVKHMYNDVDVKTGIAKPSPNFDTVYKQTRHNDPLSHGVGFVSVETSVDEWVSPVGKLVVSATTPGAGYVPAPRYRGFGPGYLTYIIEPDAAEDVFKLTEVGALIKVQTATAQAPWFPEMNDNDLLINVQLDRNGNVVSTGERYQLKMTNPTSIRGLDRRGYREYTEDGGNRFVVNQAFEMTLVPTTDELYNVETDR